MIMDDDDHEFAHIGDVSAAPNFSVVESNDDDDDDDDVVIHEVYSDFTTSKLTADDNTDLVLRSTSIDEDGVRRSMHRSRSHDNYFNNDTNNNDTNYGENSYDSSIAHVYGGLICLPATYEYAIERDTSSSSSDTSIHPPTFAMGQSSSSDIAVASSSSVTLYASFPPPPIVMSSSYDSSNDDYAMTNSLNIARRQLHRQKGIHLSGVGITTVTTPTRHGRRRQLGYSNAIVSFGYRIPSIIQCCWPTTLMTGRQRRRITRRNILIGDVHYNIYTGAAMMKSHSMGSTLTTLDGRTRFRFDISDPLSKQSKVHRDCTFVASHDFGRSPLSLRADCTARLTTSQHHRLHANMNIFQYFNVSLSTRNSSSMTSLSLGYGVPQSITESSQWMSNLSQQKDNIISGPVIHYHDGSMNIPASTLYSSACVKVDIERHLHPSTRSCCRGSIEYLHAGRIASVETMLIRSFSSSNFSRSGVGIRHSFVGWTRGVTSWLFQLERGGVRFLVPVSIIPSNSTTVWDSFIGLCYASLLSIVVDVIVSELLCGVTSRLRLSFLKLLLGSKRVDEIVSIDEVHTNELKYDQAVTEGRLYQERLSNAKNDALRQVQLMSRQANIIAKKEDEQGGLVIVKAIYGVMDSNTRQWIQCRADQRRETETTNEIVWNTMDATTHMQFWVTDSSLHLPQQSKRHMLGFYDVSAFISEDDWTVPQPSQCITHSAFGRVFEWCKEKLRFKSKKSRDIIVVLSIRYKWRDKMYDVMFNDDEAVDLPSPFAQEVCISK